MPVLKTYDESPTYSPQLSLNFSADVPPSPKTRIADHINAITSSKITFHQKESEVGENHFILKISYLGRSYSAKGMYRKDIVRSFDQEGFSNTIIRVTEFHVLSFRDGRYVSAFLPTKDYNKLMENARDILSSPYYNKTIH